MKKIVNTFTKIFVRDGKRHRIVAVASLGDECRNNICTFSITGQIDIFCFGSWHCKPAVALQTRYANSFQN